MTLFSLVSASDLLEKCKKENDELKECTTHPDYDYTLFNLIFGLNHLYDWYLNDKEIDEKQKLACVKKFNPYPPPCNPPSDLEKWYKKLDCELDIDSYQEVIRKLCNNGKHFTKNPLEKQRKNMTSLAGAEHMQCGEPEAVCGGFDHYFYTVNIKGIDENLEIIVNRQVEEWSSFIGDFTRPQGLPGLRQETVR